MWKLGTEKLDLGRLWNFGNEKLELGNGRQL